jgi:hypothetical protein
MTASQQEEQILLAALDIAEKSHQHRCSGAIQPSNSSCNQSHSSSAQLSSVLAPQQLQRPTLTASTPLNPCNRACNTQVQHMTLTTPEIFAPQLNSTRNLSPAVLQPRLPQLQQTQPNSRLLHPHVRTLSLSRSLAPSLPPSLPIPSLSPSILRYSYTNNDTVCCSDMQFAWFASKILPLIPPHSKVLTAKS